MKLPNCTARVFFVLKENCPIRNATKRIKQILDTEYKKINLKSITMNLNYLKDKHKNSLLELLQKYENMFDGTLGKYTGSDYTIDLSKAFSYSKYSKTNSQKKVDRLITIGILEKLIIPNGKLRLLLYLSKMEQ